MALPLEFSEATMVVVHVCNDLSTLDRLLGKTLRLFFERILLRLSLVALSSTSRRRYEKSATRRGEAFPRSTVERRTIMYIYLYGVFHSCAGFDLARWMTSLAKRLTCCLKASHLECLSSAVFIFAQALRKADDSSVATIAEYTPVG